jgi:tellurite resistance protein
VGTAAASDEVFTVGSYPVDAQAENAVAAKKKAMADGQQAAFRSLLKRLVPVTDYDRLKRLSAMKSSGFLEGVSVRSERNSTTRYIASLDFSFRADSVRAILQQEGIPFVEDQAREIIVVPVVRNADGSIESGSAARAWTEVWKSLDLEHSLTPFGLQQPKAEINADAIKQAADGRGAARTLASAYSSPYVVLAIAEPDPATKRLNVTLSGIDAVGNLNLRRSYRVPDGDTAYAMELAAVIALGVLEGRWKLTKSQPVAASAYAPAYQSGSTGGGTEIAVRAQYQSLMEWSEMRRRLLSLPGVEDMHIEAESARGADLTLRYPGGASQLSSALYGSGLALENGSERLILRSAY